ncbi:MAG: CBS domain-containing protein [Acidobacteria bacterium]|nr:CBS domain-containing protein [Acidobacteriota bacterium]MCB9399269.1 CBS domain-containing protein [Acidobacteriota bacterium]
MGEHDVKLESDQREISFFLKRLLTDVRALEQLMADGWFDTGARRIGAEQEIFLVDSNWKPAPLAPQILEQLNDPMFVTELAQFNLEFNLDPLLFSGNCLSQLEEQLKGGYQKLVEVTRKVDGHVVLSGILPTLSKSDLGLENMTPNPRYFALNRALNSLKGGPYAFKIKGIDEINVNHDSVMVEACNTSFQVHFQVAPDEFAGLYNVSQAVLAPVLAAACNSPMLFGKRLWHETRIGLFEQSIDTRADSHYVRDNLSRVTFGRDWVKSSPLEIFREDISRFRAILSSEEEEDPFKVMARKQAPALKALRLHNGTIYRWNRICYGITEGVPHFRIENRVLPSGPTLIDEVANAAFWFGLMAGASHVYGDISERMPFEDAKQNFINAARAGINAQITWVEMKPQPAQQLILEHLLPLARSGLEQSGITRDDIDKYLGVLEERVRGGQTGSQWMLGSFQKMDRRVSLVERMTALTSGMVQRQEQNIPVAQWAYARLEEGGGWRHSFHKIEQIMSTDLITVQEHEPIELVANMMDWHTIRHVLVEDNRHRLVGLISHRALIRYLGQNLCLDDKNPVLVRDLMQANPLTIEPEQNTLTAIKLMREQGISCLPVVKNGELVGVVTDSDFMKVASLLLEQQLLK